MEKAITNICSNFEIIMELNSLRTKPFFEYKSIIAIKMLALFLVFSTPLLKRDLGILHLIPLILYS